MESKALVSRGPFSQGGWKIEDVKLRELKDDEVVVEIVASGICHTDLYCGDNPDDKGVPAVFYPRVLGHEGSGYVREVGKAVTSVKPGDPVLLSFSYCGECHVCKNGPPSHCTKFFEINFTGGPVFLDQEGGSVGGRFFGQSSFARHTIVSDKSVVNVGGLGLARDDLKLLAPLGCGLQTGSGTVVNVARAGADDAVAVVGMGGVGLAAVMAAKNQKCRAIVGIDRVAARLELARSLGATHVFNTSDLSADELVVAVREATGGLGASVSIDTSAYPPLVAAQVEYTRNMAKIIQVGTGMPDAHLTIQMATFMVSGKQFFGAVEGHSRPKEYVPQMIRWWKEGKFPVERLIKFFDFENFEDAVKAMETGEVVKPVIVW
ncbi:Aryl-alcohol dehydrogenase [Cytospora mali]|uniref:Aryl-alcohol dehydrogenase n=1 Tax=Cytospora mali TaxID=578113 RepID=A0A194VYS9_CYTMA|nr:Aryl-alcohol dehydrogenase [Valsa mali]